MLRVETQAMCRTCTACRERMLFQRVVYKEVMGKPSSKAQFTETNQEMQEVGLISSRNVQVKSWRLQQSLLSYRRHYPNCPVEVQHLMVLNSIYTEHATFCSQLLISANRITCSFLTLRIFTFSLKT